MTIQDTLEDFTSNTDYSIGSTDFATVIDTELLECEHVPDQDTVLALQIRER